jgi:glycosyltransferase involved in cell wall biosynthesis
MEDPPGKSPGNDYPLHLHAWRYVLATLALNRRMMEAQNPAASAMPSRIGVVIIGRNEGERLRRCLVSLAKGAWQMVYVDSGSSDGSVALARSFGAHVVILDPTLPFTAARARNAGLDALREIAPEVELVQFVDGDCEVADGWIERAAVEFPNDDQLAVVCGRRRERFPQASVYNLLCDIEWDTPVGLADSCGGDAMMRVRPVVDVHGYNPDLIAGEEPDLCLRLRQRGYRIRRIEAEMTLHDANVTRFKQWLRRTIRSGHAYAEGFTRHRREPGRFWAREVRSNLFWGAVLPAVTLGLAWPLVGLSLVALLGYPILVLRINHSSRLRGMTAREARTYAIFCVMGKIPSAYGQIRYWLRHARGRRTSLIEYK